MRTASTFAAICLSTQVLYLGCDDGHNLNLGVDAVTNDAIDDSSGTDTNNPPPVPTQSEQEPNNTIIGGTELVDSNIDISGNLPADDQDVFELPVSRDTIYWVVVETDPSSKLDLSLEIRASDGSSRYAYEDANGEGAWEGTFIYSTGALVEDRVYIILKDAKGATSAGHVYWLRIRAAKINRTNGLEAENNDIISQSTKLDPGQTLQGSISAASDVDYFSLGVSDPRVYYGVFVYPDPLSNLDLQLGIVDIDNSRFGWADYSGAEYPEFVISRSSTGEGRYVVVEESDNVSSGATAAGSNAIYSVTAMTMLTKYGK